MTDWKNILKQLDKFKYPLLVLLIGILLMLLPGSIRSPTDSEGESDRFSQLLSRVEGVGKSDLLISDNGIVIVCEGAEDAEVQLHLLQAIRSYTGFGSDRITILKMTEHGRGG